MCWPSFAQRLEAIGNTTKPTDPQALYRFYTNLTMLHIYLQPSVGLRTVHLGTNTGKAGSIRPEDAGNRTFELGANSNLPGTAEELASLDASISSHETQLKQALGEGNLTGIKNLLTVLNSIISQHGEAMLTVENNHQNGILQTALTLTAVLFDLYRMDDKLHPRLKELAVPLTSLQKFWSFRTCWYEHDGSPNILATLCYEKLGTPEPATPLANAITREITDTVHDGHLNQNNRWVAHKIGYAARALKTIVGEP